MKMLFIDELIRSPKINGEHAETRNHLQQSRAFLVQNILPTVPEDIDYSHLPRLAPPYEACWFEWTTAVKKRDDVPEDFSGELDEQLVEIMLNMEGDARVGVQLTSNHDQEAGWSLYFQFFVRIGDNNPPLMMPLAYVVKLDTDSYFTGIQKYVEDEIHPVFAALATNVLQEDILQKNVDTVLYALGLLNCKNIVTIQRGGLPDGMKRSRHRKRTHRYYILQIRPMREVIRIEDNQERNEESVSDDLSFHFCRGHFKIYTAEKPLFGKYVGTFWWDAHARGSIKKGSVTKDYSISPPEN